MNRISQLKRVQHAKHFKRGVMKTEAMLATAILLTAMSFASTMVHRINHLWSDAQRHQFAISELSNQVDRLVRLTPEQADEALASIDVSEACKRTLKDASLSGTITKDELGDRLTLRLTWNDRKNANPVKLSGWLRGSKADGGDQ